MVEKRQEKVMDSAVKSTAVVTSLFPTAVHDRLFAGKQEEKPEEKKNAWLAGADNPAAGGLQGSFTHVGHNSNSNLSAVSANKKNKGRPIADKFCKYRSQNLNVRTLLFSYNLTHSYCLFNQKPTAQFTLPTWLVLQNGPRRVNQLKCLSYWRPCTAPLIK